MKHFNAFRVGLAMTAAANMLACGTEQQASVAADQGSDDSEALVGGTAASTTTFPTVGKFEQVAYIPTGTAVPTAHVRVGNKTYPLLCVPGNGTVYTITGVDGIAQTFCMGTGATVTVAFGSQNLQVPSGAGTPLSVPFAGCTATLIPSFGSITASGTNVLALTAGHCVVKSDTSAASSSNLMSPSNLRFTLAPNTGHSDTLTFQGVHVHAAFNPAGTFESSLSQEDIAVVEMAQIAGSAYRPKLDPLYYSRGTGGVGQLPANTQVTVVGFGITSTASTNYGTMRTGLMEIVSYAYNFFNLKTVSTTTTCNGDSGGPNYVSLQAPGSASTSAAVRYLLGVTSSGVVNCAANSKSATAFQSLANPNAYTLLAN